MLRWFKASQVSIASEKVMRKRAREVIGDCVHGGGKSGTYHPAERRPWWGGGDTQTPWINSRSVVQDFAAARGE